MTAKRAANALGVVEVVEAIRTGKLRSIDVVDACLERIALREQIVGAWTCIDAAAVRVAAIARDREPATRPLHGVPLAVKDIIDTVDLPTECGSAIYRARRTPSDAACVALARRAGAVILGKTVTTEFAYFAPGKTANPRDPRHTPGGSSSGTAAAVADEMAPAGFGTQTAASITRPASFCGVVGYKPSFGTFPLAGIKPFAESFDTLGTITRSVVDARYLRCALLGVAFQTYTRMPQPRIGLCRTPWWDDADGDSRRAVEEAARRFASAGATISELTLPERFSGLADIHKSMMAYEAARNYAFEYDAHREALSTQLVELIEQGLRIDRSDYEAACRHAVDARDDFVAWLDGCDLLLTPSAKGEAPRGLASTGDPLFSRAWTLLHVPSVTLPGFSGAHDLPVGVQLVGAFGDDERLLRFSQWAEGAMTGDDASRRLT